MTTIPSKLVGKMIVDVGISNRIRTILQAGISRRFSAVEIRDELQRTGFYMGDYANALATIYTTLERMVAVGGVIEHQEASGKRYQWNPLPSASEMFACT
jgi:Fe2+ or Zn2+ uptake regulation protein